MFELLEIIDSLFWEYIGFILIVSAGAYLTFKTKAKQFRALSQFSANIKEIYSASKDNIDIGVNPLKLYFASVGGMVGLGNIVFISMAVMLGGPGVIFWMWIASFAGMLLKYAEIYLGVKYRVRDKKNSYHGGPMYFLQEAFQSRYVALTFACLMAFYGVLVNRIESTFKFDRNLIICVMLIITIYSALGGIRRLSNICSVMMPPFMLIYVIACLYIIGSHIDILPQTLVLIFTSAFNGQAAIGGFAGSSLLWAAYMGTSKAVYSGDIGIGYDSIVQSETRIMQPQKQAILAIYALFTDTIICTMTTLIVVISDAWRNMNHLPVEDVIEKILGIYFPYMDYFMTILLFFAAFTTIIAYLTAGVKCAIFINYKYGKRIYLLFAICSFIFFSFYPPEKVVLVMSVASGFLVLLNICGILKLRNKIQF